MLLGSCKNSSNTNSTSTVEKLVVAFTSPGSGIDNDMKKRFDALINDSYSSLKYQKNGYGREGEIEYCITSEGMSQKDFFKIC